MWILHHVYQGRFKSFPVQSNEHYLTVLRYVESNPRRAKIVKNSRDRQYSSLAIRNGADKEGLKIRALPEDFLAYHQVTLSPYRGMRGPVIETNKYPSVETCARAVLDNLR